MKSCGAGDRDARVHPLNAELVVAEVMGIGLSIILFIYSAVKAA